MTIDPKTLRLFVRTLELGTIAAAAEREHIAAAAVSKRIRDLEEYLGTELVRRSNKGLEATAAGVRLLELAGRILNDLESVRTQMRDYASGVQGHVTLYANISAINQFVPAELSRFVSYYPQISLQLEESLSLATTQALLEGRADVGILVMSDPVDGLTLHRYREDDLVVAVPPDHALATHRVITFEQTLAYDYVGLPTRSQLNRQLTDAAQKLGRPWRCRVQVTSYDALCRMVEAGLGLGILPRRTAEILSKAMAFNIVALDEPWAHRVLAVGLSNHIPLSPAAQLLVEHLLRKP